MISIAVAEWQTRSPADCPELRGRHLVTTRDAMGAAQTLTDLRALFFTDEPNGTAIRATSYVGTVEVDDLRITIVPKIRGAPLLHLLRYAYGLRNLKLFAETEHTLASGAFQELLIAQLVEEADELLRQGLRREYVQAAADLQNPRGRIDFAGIVRRGFATSAALPCRYYPRIDDCLVNRVLLAGLHQAVPLTSDGMLRARLRRIIAMLSEGVRFVRLDRSLLERSHRAENRLTAAYRPALRIIELLYSGDGTVLEEAVRRGRFRGFLFDMNRFFQALVSRLLRENLRDYRVRDEHVLRGVLAYIAGHNPKHRQDPSPRPDFVVLDKGSPRAVLDAKYRDLWEHSLPRDMLYQLAIYALSAESSGRASIIYPTLAEDAREQRVELREPIGGRRRGEVVLRPLNLMTLYGLLEEPISVKTRARTEAEARRLAFGQ